MAHTMNVENAVVETGGVNTSGNASATPGFAIRVGTINLSSFSTSETFQAGEFGLSKIHGLILGAAKAASGATEAHIFTAVPSTDEKSVVVVVRNSDDGGADSESATGELAYVAFGESL